MKDYQALLSDASKKIANSPLYAGAYRQRGELKMRYEDYAGAIEDFTDAIKLQKRHAITWFNRGLCFYYLEKDFCAMSDYTIALKYKPSMSHAWCELGRVMLMMDDCHKAEEYCTKALKINNRNFGAWSLRGYIRLLLKKPNQAIEDLTRAQKINTFEGQNLLFKAFALQNLKRYEEALEFYDITIAIAPNVNAYLNRAIVLMELEQYQGALSDAKKALKMAPEWESCYEVIDEIEERRRWYTLEN